MARVRTVLVWLLALILLAPAAASAEELFRRPADKASGPEWHPWKADPGRHRGKTAPAPGELPHREEQLRAPTDARQPVSAAAATAPEELGSDRLGLEKFHQYTQIGAGAGAAVMVNAANGNAVLGWNILANPSLGPAAFLRMTYNSLDPANSSAGRGWSVAASTLTRLGAALEFRPGSASAYGYAEAVRLTDGDGTTHTFRLNRHGVDAPERWDYDHPPGVHLHVAPTGAEDPARAWVLTRPDRTQFFFDRLGLQTAVVDRNGNTLRFEYDDAEPKFAGSLRRLVDAAGRVVLTLDYLRPGDDYTYLVGDVLHSGHGLANAALIGQLYAVTDVSGRRVQLTYDEKGLLGRIADAAGTPDERSLRMAYAADPHGNPRLASVQDPMGHTTSVDYADDGRVRQITDRRGSGTFFDWTPTDQGGTTMAVTDALGRVGAYTVDALGRPVAAQNAKAEVTRLTWDSDNNVTELEDAAGARTTWEYDHKTGNPLTITDAVANAGDKASTGLSYRTYLDGHVADLVEKVSPEGRRWTFGHDAYGNLISLTDPRGNAKDKNDKRNYTSRNVYDSAGRLLEAVDARGNTTRFADFDPTGSPRTITDALGHSTTFVYDAVGNVLSATNAHGHSTTRTYDVRGRPLSSKVPIDTDHGVFAVTPPPVYDRNDNVLRSTTPDGAVSTSVYDETGRVVTSTAPGDDPGGPGRVTTMAYDAVGNPVRATTPRGNETPEPDDYTSFAVFDELGRIVETRDALGGRKTMAYDRVGNMVATSDPRTNARGESRPTSTTAYDLAHRPVETRDAVGATGKIRYDRDGNAVAKTDAYGTESFASYDARGALIETRVPHRKKPDGSIEYRTTRYEYDEAGNRTRTWTPRAIAENKPTLTGEAEFDALNRVVRTVLPYDPAHGHVNQRDEMRYEFDAVGSLVRTTAPASRAGGEPLLTQTDYFDNGKVKSSVDPWQIETRFTYDVMGRQLTRTITGDGANTRTMGWAYYPDGKLKSRTDKGAPAASTAAVADDSDSGRPPVAVGTWDAVAQPKAWSADARKHPQASGPGSFTWSVPVPGAPDTTADFDVAVYVPADVAASSSAAAQARYTVEGEGLPPAEGSVPLKATLQGLEERKERGQWVPLGTFKLPQDRDARITLTADGADGDLVADAVRVVATARAGRVAEPPAHEFAYRYDAEGNQTEVADRTQDGPGSRFETGYDPLGRPSQVKEFQGGNEPAHTTAYGYDENGNLLKRTRDGEESTYAYDPRGLALEATTPGRGPDAKPQTTTFTWDLLGRLETQVKANGNKVANTYHLDGLTFTTEEKKSGGELVARHEISYDTDGNRARDEARTMNADKKGEFLDRTSVFMYDPRNRIEKVAKTSGGEDTTEEYEHDAANNVTRQVVAKKKTEYTYDRNRLVSSTVQDAGGAFAYTYDPFGRLSRITQNGKASENYTYDGFDRVTEHRAWASPGSGEPTVTSTVYDPLDRRTRSTTDPAAGPAKTTEFEYLGLGKEVVSEKTGDEVKAEYEYGPFGERLSQTKPKSDSDKTKETTYFGYGPHADVEAVTDRNGDTKATYGYTAYGSDDPKAFSGPDKPSDPGGGGGGEAFNSYRFNSMRWDGGSQTYDMGFRGYSPGRNQFLSRDMYNGALADLNLGTDPWSTNRYSFAGGNPVSNIEIDGHFWAALGHAVLDVVGTIPFVGEVADVANAAWYAAEGNYEDAALSLASAVPGIGYAATAAKAAKYGKLAFKEVKREFKQEIKDVLKDEIKDLTAEELQAQLSERLDIPLAEVPLIGIGGKRRGPAKAKPAVSAPKPQGGSCARRSSFVPGTPVLMADGSAKPIEEVRPGDKVAAADPETGAAGSRAVTAGITSEGPKDLVTVHVDTDGPSGEATAAVTATGNHPFWVEDLRRWLPASELRAGQLLRTGAGTYVQVTAVAGQSASQRVHNLTVADFHTYYVVAGATPVLVHNSDGCESIALGLSSYDDDPMYLMDFADSKKAKSYKHWPSGGDDWVNELKGYVKDGRTKIHFNLDGIDDPVAAARIGARHDPRDGEHVTAWELSLIRDNPGSWDRVTFYRRGQGSVANPFGS
ncbi:polymorphic toxin-type HINT domain-containing protein [Yinghuangia soli]|uniref:Hint domain-containing protein n=1 Tax=Yinghuangia soli TaxID=2908204 RepID=A0AA41TY44_9ACTN|nr:polymorphic toxin-type HINT domain-containing protein [Yinghuangia soli]MCF2525765.1 hypothetical protein [Yinghuangia soli]